MAISSIWFMLLTVILSAWASAFAASSKNGFDLGDASIPVEEILPGGPPRDGIPAIDHPRFVPAAKADFMAGTERVLGVFHNSVAKAYPVAILNWHEIVNDRFGADGIAITFCPLCGTGMAFKSDSNGKRLSFGVSGLLYNSDVLLYDRESESLWSQIAHQAVTGPLKGTRLEMVPVSHTTWADWSARHPETLVLSTDTGYSRDYGHNPYAGYASSPTTLFPVPRADARYHPKEQVIGLELGKVFKAYPFSELARAGAKISDTVAGQTVTVEFAAEHRTGRVLDRSGAEIPTVIAFWFAWTAFHPDTLVYGARPR